MDRRKNTEGFNVEEIEKAREISSTIIKSFEKR